MPRRKKLTHAAVQKLLGREPTVDDVRDLVKLLGPEEKAEYWIDILSRSEKQFIAFERREDQYQARLNARNAGPRNAARDDEIVRLHDVERWTFKRIGKHFGIDPEAARKAYNRKKEEQAGMDA